MERIQITSEYIKLDQFLKYAQVAMTGGEAKEIIAMGFVTVNGETETRRGKKLYIGDKITVKIEEEYEEDFTIIG